MFNEIHGVDITKEMMEKVDLSSGNITLHESIAEETPFPSETFDFATAYSFMDHLINYRDFLLETFRVLKKGGVFYSDLNPNRDFITAIGDSEKIDIGIPVNQLISREIQGAFHNGAHYEKNFGMNAELLEKAEPVKTKDNGFCASEVLDTARSVGFTKCNVGYEWFLGQAKIMHQQSINDASIIEKYLNMVLPVSTHLFKYLRFVFIK